MDNEKLDIALQAWGDKVIEKAKRNLIRQKKKDSGKLINSMQAKASNGVLSFSFEKYGIAVDTGRDGKKNRQNRDSIFGNPAKAAFPKLSAIKKWINRKPINPKKLNNKKISVDSLAYVIGRKIYIKGIKPSLFFTKAFEAELPGIGEMIVQAFSEDLAESLNELDKIETT